VNAGYRTMLHVKVGAPVLGALLALSALTFASAHAEPVTTSPADGATVTVLPTQVSMVTSEQWSPTRAPASSW
jgi:methionine-rich copper-binding protein CopC